MPKRHQLQHQICKPGIPYTLSWLTKAPNRTPQGPQDTAVGKPPPAIPSVADLPCLPGCPGLVCTRTTAHFVAYRKKGAGRQSDQGTEARWKGCHCNSRYVHYLFSFLRMQVIW